MKPAEELGIGLMVRFNEDPSKSFERLRAFGLRHCQLAAPPDEYLYGAEGRRNTRNLISAMDEYGISATSLFISFPNQSFADMNSIGLVPASTRAQRIARACRSADWAREMQITQIASHVGCIPEDAEDSNYPGFVDAMRGLCLLLEANGQVLAYETGPDSVATMSRTIRDVGVENQRINFDPANLLIYNQDDPMKLLDEMGGLVVHIHCKDACRPSVQNELGCETMLGKGGTGFAKLFKRLYRQGYRGPLTIEREINAGTKLDNDIIHAVQLLKKLTAEMEGAK